MNKKKSRHKLARKMLSSVACLLIGLTPEYSFAVDAPLPENPAPEAAQAAPDVAQPAATSQPAPAASAPAAPAAPSQETAAPQPQPNAKLASAFTQAQLEQLLGPIALYPDSLLAQILPASAYPIEIVQAERWLEKNPDAVARQDFSGADAQNWDPSVKALLRFPDVLKTLSADLSWTTSLGDAIVNQPNDVANAIQVLRAKAMKTGSLKTTPQQRIAKQRRHGREIVTIQSADPSVVYVPSYDPGVVYNDAGYDAATAVAAGLLTFGAGAAIGSLWNGNYWNWGTGSFYRPVWPGYPAWRPPYAGWRPGAPINAGNINFRNGVSNRPWRPEAGRYRPGGRPGLGGGGGARPGIGAGVGAGIGAGLGAGAAARRGAGVGKARAHPRPGARPATRHAGRHAARRPAHRAAGPRHAGYRGAPRGFHGGYRGVPRGMHGGFRGGPRGFHGGGFHGGGFRGGGRGGGFRGGGGRGGRRSDYRLKHDVTLLGQMPNGLGFYRFVYNGGHTAFVGVIAQEVKGVMPEAVFRAKDGYLRVEYGKIGVKFQSYEEWLASGRQIPAGSVPATF